MRRQRLDVRLDGGKHMAYGIEADVCPHCGEQLYDPQAMRMMEAACPPRRRRRGKAIV